MIGTAKDGLAVSITGLGCKVPDRVVTNDELAEYVDTSNEWILERTGIRERRMASKEEAPPASTRSSRPASKGRTSIC